MVVFDFLKMRRILEIYNVLFFSAIFWTWCMMMMMICVDIDLLYSILLGMCMLWHIQI